MRERLEILLSETLRPLIEADGGEIELISCEASLVVLSLGGACSGCPGLAFTHEDVILPALRAALGPDIELELRRGPARALSLPPAANAGSDR